MDPFEEIPKASRSAHTRDETIIRRFARYALLYHLGLIPVVLLMGDWLLRMADRFGGLFDMRRIAIGENHFWMAPIVGVLMMLAFACFRVWRKPAKLEWLQPLLLIHGISAASFFTFYFLDVASMAYLLATILEVASFAVTLYFFWTYRDMDSGTPAGPSLPVGDGEG